DTPTANAEKHRIHFSIGILGVKKRNRSGSRRQARAIAGSAPVRHHGFNMCNPFVASPGKIGGRGKQRTQNLTVVVAKSGDFHMNQVFLSSLGVQEKWNGDM